MKVAVFGATSAIAQATARRFAADGADLALIGRSQERLDAVKSDLSVRGAKRVETFVADLAALDEHEALIERVWTQMDGLDAVLIAHGTLGDQPSSQANAAIMLHELTTNALSAMSLLTILANRFETRGTGCLAVITSVAGDRGRRSNYVYGSAKAALTTFSSGLRARFANSNVKVVTIKPGFVDTPMTAHITKKGPLFASPAAVGGRIYEAMLKGEDVVYVPWFWRPIMTAIVLLPERIFKKLKF